MVAPFLLSLLAGCAGDFGKMTNKPTVALSASCETPLAEVAHYPTVPDVTDARVAWKGERSRLDLANERIKAGRECHEAERSELAGGK